MSIQRAVSVLDSATDRFKKLVDEYLTSMVKINGSENTASGMKDKLRHIEARANSAIDDMKAKKETINKCLEGLGMPPRS